MPAAPPRRHQLRALAALEVVRENGSGGYSLTEVGALLRSDRPDSMHAVVQMFADPVMVQAWSRLEGCMRTGDFFASVPEGGDLYLCKSVVHDWDDERAAAVLGRCRQVMPDHGRLLVVEPVLPDRVDGSAPALTYLSDLNMLVNVGGRERTRSDLEELCRRSGFALTTVIPLPPPVLFSAIEATPV